MKLTASRISAALRRAGRNRGIDQAATGIKADLRTPQLRQPLHVETAMGRHTLALLAVLDTACVNIDELGQAAAELLQTHPDHAIITSFPGLADSTGARVLAEIGDDRTRFADARALKACAGSAPVTRASGRSLSITHRRIKNDRLAAVGWIWAFAASTQADRSAGIPALPRRVHMWRACSMCPSTGPACCSRCMMMFRGLRTGGASHAARTPTPPSWIDATVARPRPRPAPAVVSPSAPTASPAWSPTDCPPASPCGQTTPWGRLGNRVSRWRPSFRNAALPRRARPGVWSRGR